VFEIRASVMFRQQLFDQNRLARLSAPAAARAKTLCFPECPAWFAPKSADEYEVWGYAAKPAGNLRVLIDRDTGAIFLTDFQV
jgi:hypothetical protein